MDVHSLVVAIIELVVFFNGAMSYRFVVHLVFDFSWPITFRVKVVNHCKGGLQVGEDEEVEEQENHQRAETVAKPVIQSAVVKINSHCLSLNNMSKYTMFIFKCFISFVDQISQQNVISTPSNVYFWSKSV